MSEKTTSKGRRGAKKAAEGPVLVTGASGFLGLHLVEVLRRAGLQVRGLGRKASARLVPWEVEQIEGSVADLETCRRAVAGVSAVYHCAGFVSRDPDDRGTLYDVHVTGTRHILQAAREAGVQNVVCVSTSGVVGVGESPDFMATEDSPVPWDLLRKWPYYESKAFAEKEIAAAVAEGLPVKIARPSLLLGPGDFGGSSTGDVVKFLCGDLKATLPGGLSAVDVRDVAEVLPRLMERGTPGIGYLLGAGNLPVRDFFLLLEQVSGVKAPTIGIPRKVIDKAEGLLKVVSQLKAFGGLSKQTFEMGCRFWYLDHSRAVAELGFAPRPLVDTLRDTVADLRPGLPPR